MSEINGEATKTEDLAEKLQSFIDEKRAKKEPSKADGREFERLWLDFVGKVGLNDLSMALLCDGFRYCAARPLVTYCKQSSSSTIPYATLGKYSALRNNSAEIMLRMTLSLFAYEVVDPTSAEQVAWLMKKVPEVAFNKEGKVSGNITGYVRKLVVQEVAGNTIKAAIDASAFRCSDATRFSKLIAPSLEELGAKYKLSVPEQNAVEALGKWISNLCGEGEGSIPKAGNEETLDVNRNPISSDVDKPLPKGGSSEEVSASQVVTFIQNQERRIELLRSASASSAVEMGRIKEHRDSLKAQNEELKARLEKAQESMASQAGRIADLEGRVSILSADLSANRELVDMLGQDQAKQSDEAMRRVSRKLGIEYQDYKDALDVEMSVDLGENMRLQLGEVFKILKENGFDL